MTRTQRLALEREGWKLLLGLDGGVTSYRIDVDPREEHPLVGDDVASGALSNDAKRMQASLDLRAGLEPTEALPAEARQRLRALGYVGDAP